ncbi:MAG: hypothetical protein ACXIUP_01545, partial [Microcella sp.]
MLRILKARLGDTERGLSLVIVIAVGSVLTVFVTIMMSYGLTAYTKAASDERWQSAMAAAYAGVEEYQSRLANEPAYLRYGNPAAAFSATSTVELPPTENPAFGIGTDGTWAEIPGSAGSASFRYEVDNSNYIDTGTLRIRSTGRVGDATRTIVADLRQQGFIDFLYFTDYEMQDPQLSGAAASCVRYNWVSSRPSSCGNIAFGFGDVVNGPMHSNDTIRICDSRFRGPVTTSNPNAAQRYLPQNSNGTSCGGQVFDLPGYPSYAPVIGMPQTNTQMRREVRSDLPIDVPRPGCLYTGPTRITLNSNGTITVYSPWTRATRVAGEPASSGTAPAACGSLAALQSPSGATFTPPENNLIFVQNVPAVSTDPNFWASSARPTGLNCRGEAGSSIVGNTTSPSTVTGNGIGFPRADEQAPRNNSYDCRVGDVFVQGTMSGNLTIASENYIYVTGDIVYADSQEDMLGLVGNNSIFIWNPVRSNGTTLLGNTNRRIDAAMLSVERTIEVQNFGRGGDRGVLNINGAMAQRFRGIVRQTSGGIANGYAKNYVYDPRLRYTAPPKFLSPVTTTYGINVWIETERAFDP